MPKNAVPKVKPPKPIKASLPPKPTKTADQINALWDAVASLQAQVDRLTVIDDDRSAAAKALQKINP